MSANNSAVIQILLDAAQAKTEAKATSKELDQIGKAAQQAGVSGTEAFNQVTGRIAANRAEVAQLEKTIRQNGQAILATEQSLEKFNRNLGENSAQSQKARQIIDELSQSVADATTKKQALAAETKVLEQALNGTSGAAELTTRQMFAAGAAIDRLGGVAVGGTRGLGLLAGALTSGVSLGSLAALAAVSLLIGELVKLLKSSSDNIQIGKELIQTDVALSAVFDHLAKSGDDVGGSLQKQSERYRSLLQSDVSSLLTTYVAQYRELAKAQDEVKRADEASHAIGQFLNEQRQRNADITKLGIQTDGEWAVIQEMEARNTAKATEEAGKHEKTINATVEALLAANRAGIISTDTMYAMAKAAGADANAMAFLRGEIEKATNAQEELNAAARNFRPVGLDTKAQEAVVEQMRQQIVLARNQGATLAQLTPRMKELREESAKLAVEQASNTGKILNWNQAHEATRKVMAGTYDSILPLADALGVYDKNVKTATQDVEHHTKAHGEQNKVLREENTLTRQLKDAQAALIGDNFASRNAKIDADIEAEKRAMELSRKNRSLTANEEATFNALSVARHEKVLQDKFFAEQRFQDDLRQIQIKGIQLAEERERAQLDFQIEKKAEALIKEFGISSETAQKISAYRKATEDEFTRWLIDHNLRVNKAMAQQRLETERIVTTILEEEELKRSQAVLRSAREAAQARTVAGKFLLSQGQGASSGEIDRFLSQLKQLGPAFDDVDKRAESTKQAIDYVRNSFGFASNSAQMFQLKLDMLSGHSISFGQVMTAVFSEMFTTVQGATALFEGFGQALSSVFEGIVSGTENAKAAFLNFLATLLMQMGQMAIAIGTIMLFIPGHHGLGIALIAAGIAAMALAGVFRGLASNAQKSAQGAGSGGGSSSGAGPAPANGPAPPKVISFPTSGPLSRQPMAVSMTIDRRGFKDALDGHEVVFEGMFRGGRGTSIEMVRRVRKMAKT